MLYLFKTAAILVSCLVMASCGLQRYAKHTDVAGYPHRHTDFDYKYAWKTATTDQGVVIDGVMKNVRYPYIDSLQLTILVEEKNGKIVARASTFPMLQQSRENDVSHFTLLLRDIKPAPDDVFHFLVHYSGNEGGSADWHGGFKVDALTNAVIRPQSRNPDEW